MLRRQIAKTLEKAGFEILLEDPDPDPDPERTRPERGPIR